jgi:hypothetical protein
MNKNIYQANPQQIFYSRYHIANEVEENLKEYINMKVELNGYVGVIRYCGKLKHKEDNDIWLGIEWEDSSRGKHNGTIEGVEYFKCENNAGSLIKMSKVNFGISFQEALQFKYNFSKAQENDELMSFLNKANESESYIQANRKRIEIEFIGKEKVLKKFSDLNCIENIDLSFSFISLIEENVNNLLPNIRELFLEKVLLSKWSQFLEFFKLKSLESFNFIDNSFMHFDEGFDEKVLTIKGHSVKNLVLNKCRMDFATLQRLSPILLQVETLYLYSNFINDNTIDKSVDYKLLQSNIGGLKFLSLEKNSIKDYGLVLQTLQPMGLNVLNLSQNHISAFCSNKIIEALAPNLKAFYLDYNAINDEAIIKHLSIFTNLIDLDILNNPFAMKMNLEKVKCEIIGRLLKLLTLNNTDIIKEDRKDFERLYLRSICQDYFKHFTVSFSKEDFLKHMQDNHPNYFILRKKYFDPLEDIIETLSVGNLNTIKGNILEVTFDYEGKKIKKKFPKNTTFYNLKNLLSKLFKIAGNFVFNLNSENITDESRTLDSYSISDTNIIYLI